MIRTFLLILPFAVAGAFSPVMLTEQTLLLAARDGRRLGLNFAIAAVVVLLAFVMALVLFGQVISLPKEPKLSSSLDIILGALLLALALKLRSGRHQGRKKRSKPREISSKNAFTFGAFSMATNFTTLALMVPAAKLISASDVGLGGRIVIALAAVAIASTPVWLPVLLTAVAPGPTERGLRLITQVIQRRGRFLTVVFLAALGVFLVGRGLLLWT